MSASLVGSEMCIRDSSHTSGTRRSHAARCAESCAQHLDWHCWRVPRCHCLLYTSDAADDM
eukprot:11246077-Alexandrium_andersonii.AAC.1